MPTELVYDEDYCAFFEDLLQNWLWPFLIILQNTVRAFDVIITITAGART